MPGKKDAAFYLPGITSFIWQHRSSRSRSVAAGIRSRAPQSRHTRSTEERRISMPQRLLPQAQVAVRVADKDAALENMGVQNAIAEAEAALAGEGRVLVRKSGTESVIRVLAEAPDQASADAAMKRIASALEAL